MKMDEYLWNRFFHALGVEDLDHDLVTEELILVTEHYNQRHRHYHNLAHVIRLMELCDELSLSDPDLILAVIYHDIIYKPGSLKNEEKSSAYTRESLARVEVDPDRINQVCEMIMATADHLSPPDDLLTRTFLDLDMSILGAPREEYHAYAEGVRKEHSRVPGAIFRKHRHRFLAKILAADNIFHTELFRDKYEAAARTNIKWELGL